MQVTKKHGLLRQTSKVEWTSDASRGMPLQEVSPSPKSLWDAFEAARCRLYIEHQPGGCCCVVLSMWYPNVVVDERFSYPNQSSCMHACVQTYMLSYMNTMCVRVCVCVGFFVHVQYVCMYASAYNHIHTHTHKHTRMRVYIQHIYIHIHADAYAVQT